MSKPQPAERIEFTLADGGSLTVMTGERSLFEEITHDLVGKAERILAAMKQHVAEDFENKEFREKWTPPPIPSTSDFLAALLWVIGHEREQLFAQLTKHSKASSDNSLKPE